MTNTNNARFIVDFLHKKIIGTKASFDKAGKGISPIYEELMEKTNAHPTFALEVKEQKHHTTKAKRTYDGMDFAFMEDYIKLQADADTVLSEYKAVKKFAKSQNMSVYPFVKQWFLKKYSDEKKPFDMAKAKEAISDARLESAAISIADPAEDSNVTVIKKPA